MKRQWLNVLKTVGLAALEASPLKPIAQKVTDAIAEAEQIKGASGTAKLAHVMNIAVDLAASAQKLGAHVDPALVRSVGEKAISTAVDVVNIVHDAHAVPEPEQKPAA